MTSGFVNEDNGKAGDDAPHRLPALDVNRTALFVIDFQNDFCHPDGFFGQAGHDTSTCMAAAKSTASLLDRVRAFPIEIVFTKSVNENPPVHLLPPRRFAASRDSEHFVEGVGGKRVFVPGSWGSEFVESISALDDESIVEKTTYDAFYQTGLMDHLRSKGITTVALAGVTTNVCVETTARSAYVRGFNVLVLDDCVAAFGNEMDLHESSLRNLDLVFGVVASSVRFGEALGVTEKKGHPSNHED